MGCSHERIGCKDNRYFCLVCGEWIEVKDIKTVNSLTAAGIEKNVEQEPTKKPATKRSRKGESK
jgi:hypothetical protein